VVLLIVVFVTLASVAGAVYFPPFVQSLSANGPAFVIDAARFAAVPTVVFLSTALLITAFVFFATLYRGISLRKGGGEVAVSLGGTLLAANVSDPLTVRLRNVVEEMAIASGVPVPDIYVLENEVGINAFAAGFSLGDASVVVTQGALERLERDELQGVIAHEFSHILNGDMRLNIRLMGLLFGITAIHTIGRSIIISGYYMGKGSALAVLGFSSATDKVVLRRSKVVGWIGAFMVFITIIILAISFSIVIFGAVIALLGLLGIISSRAIKSAVSRQREYLADASAIQFTRQTDGIAGALQKIGSEEGLSYITAVDAEEVSHMLFGCGSKSFLTHPPVRDRITALDPDLAAQPMSGDEPAITPESLVESVGQPELAHVEYARKLRKSIPEDLYDAAHSVDQSYLLTLALILDRSGKRLEQQMNLLEEHLGAEQAGLLRDLQERVTQIGAEYRLPLLELAFPAIKRRPAVQLVELAELANRLVLSDGEIDLFEFCFYRILRVNLGHVLDPSGNSTRRRGSRREVAQAAVDVIAIVAKNGHEDPVEAQAALDAGTALLGDWIVNAKIDPKQEFRADALDKSLDFLLQVNAKGRRILLLAVGKAAAHDGRLNVAEGELIRVVCASLDCPLPPILVDNK
jgi:Zn-dependent protease with chaperone function